MIIQAMLKTDILILKQLATHTAIACLTAAQAAICNGALCLVWLDAQVVLEQHSMHCKAAEAVIITPIWCVVAWQQLGC